MLLMQATAYALESSWIVLYLPRALDYVVSASPYAYSASQQTYLQPSLARDVLKAILEVNTGLLKDLSTTKDLQLERAGVIAKGTTLEKLAKTGIEESTPAPARQQVLEHLVQELASQKQWV